MKLFSAHRWALVAVAMLMGPALLEAQVLRCNMIRSPTCGAPPAPGCAGCTAPAFVWHGVGFPCNGTNGSFNLIGTQYENTCALGNGCTIGQPLLRFWQYDFHAKANNGCQRQDDPNGLWWLINSFPDDGTGGAPGHWYMYQANWAGTLVDGCYNAVAPAPPQPTPRSVAEISDVLASAEGTVNHTSWYVIGSVGFTNDFDFDLITGGTGCTTGEIVQQPVRGVTIPSRAAACTGAPGTRTQSGTADALNGYFNVTVRLVDADPDWWTEAGMNGGPTLIDGYQIMYRTGAEPTSSDRETGGWLPVYDPSDTVAPKNALPVVARGTATDIVIALPETTPGTDYWLATRIVYHDTTQNPLGGFDPATGTPANPVGPQLTTEISSHCGPVFFQPGIVTAVQFGDVTATRTAQGVHVRWTTLREDDTNGFQVMRSNDAAGTEALVEASPFVSARGANIPYDAMDLSALDGGMYYYYVQELTSNGYGDRSAAVRVDPAAATTGARGASSGGRTRGRN